jgi:hypothetical protein
VKKWVALVKMVAHSVVEITVVIEIEEGLTAFALSHHPAYGAVPGGSCSRHIQFVMVEEEKQALLSKETV